MLNTRVILMFAIVAGIHTFMLTSPALALDCHEWIGDAGDNESFSGCYVICPGNPSTVYYCESGTGVRQVVVRYRCSGNSVYCGDGKKCLSSHRMAYYRQLSCNCPYQITCDVAVQYYYEYTEYTDCLVCP